MSRGGVHYSFSKVDRINGLNNPDDLGFTSGKTVVRAANFLGYVHAKHCILL